MRVALESAAAMVSSYGSTTAPIFGPLVLSGTGSPGFGNLVTPAAFSSADFSTARRTESHPFSPLPLSPLAGLAASSGNNAAARHLFLRAVSAVQRSGHRSAGA